MLIGNNFNIRHIIEKDLETLILLNNDLNIRGNFLPCGITSPQKMLKQFQKNGFSSEKLEILLIVDNKDKILGIIWHSKSIPYFNAREISYILFDLKQRNKGIISQAVAIVTSYLFNTLHINRLEIRMDTKHISSEKIAVKCGYKKEGISRGANFVKGKYVDMYIYALLREEWQKSI